MWRWVNPNNQRYYQADLVKDLLGDWTLVKTWGSLDSRRGNMKICLVSGEKEGMGEIQGLMKERQRRGYQIIQKR